MEKKQTLPPFFVLIESDAPSSQAACTWVISDQCFVWLQVQHAHKKHFVPISKGEAEGHKISDTVNNNIVTSFQAIGAKMETASWEDDFKLIKVSGGGSSDGGDSGLKVVEGGSDGGNSGLKCALHSSARLEILLGRDVPSWKGERAPLGLQGLPQERAGAIARWHAIKSPYY
ncbi:hypothetical protein L1887_09520 [Cichorium endivia]|nr:hypothetical protein L1887_09520 [Cichorium endivia]